MWFDEKGALFDVYVKIAEKEEVFGRKTINRNLVKVEILIMITLWVFISITTGIYEYRTVTKNEVKVREDE